MAAASSVQNKFPTEAKKNAAIFVDESPEQLPRRSQPIAGFVSTSVLSSSDGVCILYRFHAYIDNKITLFYLYTYVVIWR